MVYRTDANARLLIISLVDRVPILVFIGSLHFLTKLSQQPKIKISNA